MTVAYGDVPLIDPVTGRFPDAFAPPSVAAAVASTAQDAADAEAARVAAEALADITIATGAVVGDDLILTRTDGGAVNAGNVRGHTGPANTLTIGTVTTGAPGSAAAASITGTAPSQVLDLTIPRGATGAVSAWEYYAAGRPDVVGTLDAAALAWCNAAPPGATFHSTDGPQGAWVWRKASGSGWDVVAGDTGLRTITSGFAGAITGVLRIARTGTLVSLVAAELNANTVSGNVPLWAIPNGFRPYANPFRSIFGQAGNFPAKTLYTVSGTLYGAGVTAGQTIQPIESQWYTSDSWPTTSPGSPA